MLKRFGRIVINTNQVTKVLSDSAKGTTTVYLAGGQTAVFKKHAAAVWAYFKNNSR